MIRHQVIKPQRQGRNRRIHQDRYVCIGRMIRNLSDMSLERHVRTAHTQKMLELYVDEMKKRNLLFRPRIRRGVLTAFLVRLDQWVEITPEPV